MLREIHMKLAYFNHLLDFIVDFKFCCILSIKKFTVLSTVHRMTFSCHIWREGVAVYIERI